MFWETAGSKEDYITSSIYFKNQATPRLRARPSAICLLVLLPSRILGVLCCTSNLSCLKPGCVNLIYHSTTKSFPFPKHPLFFFPFKLSFQFICFWFMSPVRSWMQKENNITPSRIIFLWKLRTDAWMFWVSAMQEIPPWEKVWRFRRA